MKKSLTIIGIVIVIIAIIFIGAWVWFSGLKEDRAATQAKMDKILEAYPTFNQMVNDFSNLRNQFYSYKEDLYLETLRDNAEAWNTFMSNYADGIQKVEDSAQVLKENCDLEYGDVKVSTKCTNFKVNYEAAMNYYISDVKLYNQMVSEYEKYNTEGGGKYPVVNKAEYKIYEDYIDYDKDGEYFGKEVTADEER